MLCDNYSKPVEEDPSFYPYEDNNSTNTTGNTTEPPKKGICQLYIYYPVPAM